MDEVNNPVFSKISYEQLNARQKESYNFQKVSAILADYGYSTMRLHDDWQGADFIAQHVSGNFLKVQLKGRLLIDKKYIGKEIWMCFPVQDGCYLFAHDDVMDWILTNTKVRETSSWLEQGIHHWGKPSALIMDYMERHKLT